MLPYAPVLEDRLREWLDLLGRVVRAPGGVAGLDAVGRYLLEVNDITAERLRHVLESALDPEVLEAVMTGAEQLLEEGELRGRTRTLLKQLTLRFAPLTEDVTSRVRHASVEELELWAERVLTAKSVDDVLG